MNPLHELVMFYKDHEFLNFEFQVVKNGVKPSFYETHLWRTESKPVRLNKCASIIYVFSKLFLRKRPFQRTGLKTSIRIKVLLINPWARDAFPGIAKLSLSPFIFPNYYEKTKPDSSYCR